MPLGFIGFPHVADFATLAVNVRLLILQPLTRLCVAVSYKCNELEPIDINRASGYNLHNPTLAPQATMWGPKSVQENLNRGAVADPAAMCNSRPIRQC